MLSIIRLFLPIVLVFIALNLSAQTSCNSNMKCQMSIEQIVDYQHIEKDSYEYEKAVKITEELFLRFDLFYIAVDDNDSEAIKKQIGAIDVALNSASILGMDYSMFENDIKIIEIYR